MRRTATDRQSERLRSGTSVRLRPDAARQRVHPAWFPILDRSGKHVVNRGRVRSLVGLTAAAVAASLSLAACTSVITVITVITVICVIDQRNADDLGKDFSHSGNRAVRA